MCIRDSHDTGDDGQSDGQAAVLRQQAEGFVEDDADIDMERGLTAVSWPADVKRQHATRRQSGYNYNLFHSK